MEASGTQDRVGVWDTVWWGNEPDTTACFRVGLAGHWNVWCGCPENPSVHGKVGLGPPRKEIDGVSRWYTGGWLQRWHSLEPCPGGDGGPVLYVCVTLFTTAVS